MNWRTVKLKFILEHIDFVTWLSVTATNVYLVSVYFCGPTHIIQQ